MMMKFLEKNPMVMIVIGVLGVSLSAIFVKYSTAPSLITALYRILWTVALLLPIALGKSTYRQELMRTPKKNILLCAISGIFLALHFVTWFESLNHTSVASSTVIVCTEVIWVSLGYCIFMRGRISRPAALSIMVTIFGSILIACADYSTQGTQLYGDILALLAAVFTAVYTLIGRFARTTMSTTIYTFIVYSFCGLALFLAALISGLPLVGYGSNPVLIGLMLSIFSTLLGHSIFSWCLKYLSPTFVSASKLCEPVVAAIFAIVLFQEIPLPLQILGGILILIGMLFYSWVETKS